MTGTVGIIGSNDRTLESLVRATGMRPVMLSADQLSTPTGEFTPPDVVLVDVRGQRSVLSLIASIKRQHPTMGVAIIAVSLDQELMLEAMRAGVTEALTEPLTQPALENALSHVLSQRAALVKGQVYAIVGAKGGIGATTIAVNMAEAFAQATGDALLIDLQMGAGDAAILLGVEPRFSVAEALENTHRLDETFFNGLVVHTKSGLDLLGASSRIIEGPVDIQRTRVLIEFAARHYRTVVLDIPRSDLAVLNSLDGAAAIYVVVNHELPTIRSAQRLIAKLKQQYGDIVGVLVNRSDSKAEIGLEDIKRALAVPVRFVFSSDYRLALAAVNKGQPMAASTEGRLAMSFHEFVASLTGKKSLKKDATAKEQSGVLGWLTPRRSTS